MTTPYATVKEVNVLAKLTEQIIVQCQSKLSHDQIKSIVNWSWDESNTPAGTGELEFREFNFSDVSPEIRVTSDPSKFAKTIQLLDYEMSHSWAGSDSTKEWGFIILGDVEFGSNTDCRYYDNSNLNFQEEKIIDGNFDVEQVQAVLVNREEHNHYNGACHDSDEWYLFIYIPEGTVLDEKTYNIAKEFGFLSLISGL